MNIQKFGDAGAQQLRLPQPITFGGASYATFFDGGIFGLSFPSSNQPAPPFIQGLQQGVFDEPIFTAYFGDCDSVGTCLNNGVITFGGFDDDHCSRQYTWIPLAGNFSRLKITELNQVLKEAACIGNLYSHPFKLVNILMTRLHMRVSEHVI